MPFLLSAWARCDGFPLAGSIDLAFGRFNELIDVVVILAGDCRWMRSRCRCEFQAIP